MGYTFSIGGFDGQNVKLGNELLSLEEFKKRSKEVKVKTSPIGNYEQK